MNGRSRSLAAVAVLVTTMVAGACSSSSKPSSVGSTSSTSAAGTPTGAQAAGAPIKVGVICSCSGAFAGSTAPAEETYKAWANSVNASGGISGHAIQLITEDDAANPGTSISDMQTLISDHVDAIADFSLVDEPWASTVESAKIPVVGGDITETPFYNNSDFYSEGETEDALTDAFISVAKQAGATKLAYMYCTEAAACSEEASTIATSAQKAGVPVVYKASISATAPNYTAQCVAADQSHAQAVMNGDVDPVFERVASDCSKQNYDPVYISSGESFDPSMLTTVGIKSSSWYESNDLPFTQTDNPQIQAMDAAVNKYYPGLVNKPVSWTGGTATEPWAAGLLLEDAVKGGGLTSSDTPSSAEIVQGLASLKGDTLSGLAPPLTFAAGKAHPVDCWFTYRVQNGAVSLTNGGKLTCSNGASS